MNDPALKVVSTMRGNGRQVHDCVDGKYPSSPGEPMAGLVSTRGVPTGIRGGSKVVGTSPVSAPSPVPSKDIPWLLVTKASTAGTGGVFSNVTYIRRTDTRGGVAPTTPCTVPSTVSVDYSTYYVFWAPK